MSHNGDPDEMIEVDVLDVSDLRFEGGTSGSVAEEIRAQAAAGYSTAVLHLDGPLLARATPFNPLIRRCLDDGLARLVMPEQRIRAKVVVVRHPAVLQHTDIRLDGVQADHLVVVANAAPRDIDGYEHYRVDAVRTAARQVLGMPALWAPIGPLVRAALAGEVTKDEITAGDWVNIIDVDAWAVPRDRWVSDRPVIGRHSRDNPQKWPADAATLRQAYPSDGSVRVRVLGGATAAEDVLGRVPELWDVLPFGGQDPRDFLATVDFFVYYHDPRWIEAFGRTILEALASGAVAVLPPHFEAVFGDAARYAEPAGARAVIDEFYADREAYAAQVQRGREVVRERFGHEAHIARLTDLIGPPAGGPPAAAGALRPPAAAAALRPPPAAVAPRPPAAVDRPDRADRVLLISSNGTGMGHLTRLLAYAQRAPGDVSPFFLSLSQAVPVVAQFGYPYEYVPSMAPTGLDPNRWHPYFRARVSEAVARIGPSVVVFDGTFPYRAIPDIRADHPAVAWVWSRRGMWYRGMNRDQLAKSDWFDLVIEPGDLSAPADPGVTAEAPARRVGPVTLLDRDDIDDRSAARAALGLDPAAPTALVTLGAGNINDASSATRIVIDALRKLGLHVCVTVTEIADRAGTVDEGVHVVRDYPLSRRYRAFDVAVSAAGYNSFHELLRFGVPTLFLPNLQTSLDDQRTRARYAADQGWAHSLDEPEPDTVLASLDDLVRRGSTMVAGVADADPGNGAAEAMATVREVMQGAASERVRR